MKCRYITQTIRPCKYMQECKLCTKHININSCSRDKDDRLEIFAKIELPPLESQWQLVKKLINFYFIFTFLKMNFSEKSFNWTGRVGNNLYSFQFLDLKLCMFIDILILNKFFHKKFFEKVKALCRLQLNLLIQL